MISTLHTFHNVQSSAEQLWISILRANVSTAAHLLAENITGEFNVNENGVLHHFNFTGRDQYLETAQRVANAIYIKLKYLFDYREFNEKEQKITTRFTFDYLVKNPNNDSMLDRAQGNGEVELTYELTEDENILFTKYINHENDTIVRNIQEIMV